MIGFTVLGNIKKTEKTDAVEMLIEDSYPRREFYLVSILSSGIATIGLLIDSTPLLIGSMIVAPLLYPILGAGMGIAIHNANLFIRSLGTSLFSAFFAIVFSMSLTQLFSAELTLDNTALIYRMQPSIAMALVALFSGFVSSLAVTRPTLNTAMSGVAVSVALIPPVAAIGIGLILGDFYLAQGAAQLFLLNLIIIMFAAAIIFSYLDFGKDQSKKADQTLEKEKKKTDQEQKPKPEKQD